MGYKKIDISELIDPAIQCDDQLIVNVDKKTSLISGLVFVGISIVILVLSISKFSGLPIWGIGIILLIGLLYTIQNLVTHNPVLKIDKTGVSFSDKEFYSWDSIDKIVYEQDKSNEGSSYLKFYLKDEKEKELTNDGFLDQPISVIATYINRYFRNK
jgi:hypothetical protein